MSEPRVTHHLLAETLRPWPSLSVLLTLLLLVSVSVVVFAVLVRRATSHRRWVALSEWARDNRFRLYVQPARALVPLLDRVKGPVDVQCSVSSGRAALVQFASEPPVARESMDLLPGLAPQLSARPTKVIWNILVRPMPMEWPATGLRPAEAAQSLLDLFSLSSFPQMGNVERFVVYGSDSSAAALLSSSSARALLPRDVGLLLIGRYLVLDFSVRPFDALEFTRVLAIAEQIATHLLSVRVG